jgi:hypothetical protein
MSPQAMTAFAFANGFMEVAGDVVMGWMLLWRGALAAEQLANGARKKDEGFYQGQVKSAQFFIQTLLPVTMGKMDAIMGNCAAAVEIDDKSFGG